MANYTKGEWNIATEAKTGFKALVVRIRQNETNLSMKRKSSILNARRAVSG